MKENCIPNSNDSKDEIITTLSNLYMGFQGIGGKKDWCAQSFLPISQEFLAGETLYNKKKCEFYHDKHNFFARGGEVLYLQICTALTHDWAEVKEFLETKNIEFDLEQDCPAMISLRLNKGLSNFFSECPETLSTIASFIDKHNVINTDSSGAHQTLIGSTPSESWREGYVFAIELARILENRMDIIEWVELLETECVLQVFRSIIWRSYARLNIIKNPIIPLTAQRCDDEKIKKISQFAKDSIFSNIKLAMEKQTEGPLEKKDNKTGYKLLNRIGKNIGLIIPKKGKGERFVLNSRILTCLIVTTVNKFSPISLFSFKEQIENRFGFVFDVKGYGQSIQEFNSPLILSSENDEWFSSMLDNAGCLITLADSFALVENNL
jgi:hypothetical protein